MQHSNDVRLRFGFELDDKSNVLLPQLTAKHGSSQRDLHKRTARTEHPLLAAMDSARQVDSLPLRRRLSGCASCFSAMQKSKMLFRHYVDSVLTNGSREMLG